MTKKRALYLIGCGGHARSCIDVIETSEKYRVVGLFGRDETLPAFVFDYPIISVEDQFEGHMKPESWFLIALGGVGLTALRRNLFENLYPGGPPSAPNQPNMAPKWFQHSSKMVLKLLPEAAQEPNRKR